MPRKYRDCVETHKVGYKDQLSAKHSARQLARRLMSDGVITETMHTYQCPHCCKWHLTRMSEYKGKPLPVAHIAAPVDAQLWAMKTEVRPWAEGELIEREERQERRSERTGMKYANRPRNLRRL